MKTAQIARETTRTVATLGAAALGVAGYAVRHPARSALRVAGFTRGVAGSLRGDRREPPLSREAADLDRVERRTSPSRAQTVPPSSPTPPTGPTPVERPVEQPIEGNVAHEVSPAGHDDRHGGTAGADLADWAAELDDGQEITTSAGTTGVAPEINPATGLPHHPPTD